MSTAPARTRSSAALGLTVFAATIMMMVGSFQAIQGIIALANDTFFVVGAEYVFQLDVTTWGWIHLLLGALLVTAGVILFRGAVWARTVGVIAAALSALFNFAWLPYYPIWPSPSLPLTCSSSGR